MITFIWIVALIIVVGAGFLVASSANQRKRSGMSGKTEVAAEAERGGGQAPVGRATGND